MNIIKDYKKRGDGQPSQSDLKAACDRVLDQSVLKTSQGTGWDEQVTGVNSYNQFCDNA